MQDTVIQHKAKDLRFMIIQSNIRSKMNEKPQIESIYLHQKK